MAPAANEPNPSTKGGGLWARLRGAFQSPAGATPTGEVVPTFDDIPEASPVPVAQPASADAIPVAAPVEADRIPIDVIPAAVPVATPVAIPTAEPLAPALPPEQLSRTAELCGYCKTPRVGDAQFCFDCGMMFPETAPLHLAPEGPDLPVLDAPAVVKPGGMLGDRYELGEQISVRGPVTRFHGLDHGQGDGPVPVLLVRMAYTPPTDQTIILHGTPTDEDSENLHASELPPTSEPATSSFARLPADIPTTWPGIGWEWSVLTRVKHPCIPRIIDHFQEGQHYYLVEETHKGPLLWDVWDDPECLPGQRFNALAQLAEGLQALHTAGAVLEGIRPDIVIVTPQGHATLTDLSDLLPLPVPAEAPVQATLYTAPELVLDREHADARTDLYSFGAMLYALFLGRELTDMDFIRHGVPKPFVELDPDVHPALARVVMKTFVREVQGRFPTDEAAKSDPTGFTELAQALRGVGRAMSRVRFDIAGWTTTGKARSGNEDAFAVLHAVASHQEEAEERALLILADGMGGAEAGEVASAMAIAHLRLLLLRDNHFRGLDGQPVDPVEGFDLNTCQRVIGQALADTNMHIRAEAQKPGVGRRGMGCTAEVVYLDGQRAVIGHVGDSRTYHYANGKLTQVTRDQTLVNRLIELGRLTPQEAENHPQKNELQQAIGGQPFLDPGLYHMELRPGQWLLVCSDGLTNHVDHATLTEMIQRADSAEMLTRRLCNLANLQGGSDNTTVIAARIT
jgi:protein phosphatase